MQAMLYQAPLIDRTDFKPRVRGCLALTAAGLSCLMLGAAVSTLLWGRLSFVPEVGFARLVECASALPFLGPWTPAILAFENAVTALFFAVAAIAFWRYLPPPDAGPDELLLFRSRQARHLRWSWLTKGLLLLGGASTALHLLHSHAAAALDWSDLQWRALAGAPLFPRGPGAAATVVTAIVAGVLELLSLQWLARFAWVALMPFPRAFIVVIQDRRLGFANRVVIGDGRFRRQGHLTIQHSDLLRANLRTTVLGQTLLGLAGLEIVYRDADRQAYALYLDALPNPPAVQRLAQVLNSEIRRGVSRESYSTVMAMNATQAASAARLRAASAARTQ